MLLLCYPATTVPYFYLLRSAEALQLRSCRPLWPKMLLKPCGGTCQGGENWLARKMNWRTFVLCVLLGSDLLQGGESLRCKLAVLSPGMDGGEVPNLCRL